MISTIENTRHSLQAATGVFICIVYFQAIAVVFPLSFSVKMCYDRENDCEVAIVDKLVRKIEIPLARQRIKNAGLYIVPEEKLLTYETFAMKLKKKYTGHVDWYLYNLSIKKSAQGQGIATKLLRPMLEFCDDEKIVTYLETNKESNVSLYEHFGFDLQETNLIPGSPVNHYSMVREPKERGETD